MDFGSLAALVKLIAAVAVAVPLTAYVMQEKLIFQSRPMREQDRQIIAARHQAQVADIFLQAVDGTRVHAWHFKAAPGAPLVLYFGGNAEEVSWLLDELPRRDTGAPFDSMVEVGKRHYPSLPVSWLLKHRFDSLSLAPTITVPLLCIVATQDEVIPAEHARRLYDAWGGPKQWLELAATHNSIDGHPDYWPTIRAFLAAR